MIVVQAIKGRKEAFKNDGYSDGYNGCCRENLVKSEHATLSGIRRARENGKPSFLISYPPLYIVIVSKKYCPLSIIKFIFKYIMKIGKTTFDNCVRRARENGKPSF